MAASLFLGSMMGAQQGYTFNINEAQVKTNQGHGPSPGFVGQSTHGRGMVTGLLQGPSLVVQGSTVPIGSFAPICTRPSNQHPSPGQIQQSTPSQPVHYAAPVQFLQAPHIQTPMNEFAAQAPVHYAARPPVQFLPAPGPQQIQTQLKQFATQAPVHYAAPQQVQVLPALGLQNIQLKQLPRQAPIHYAAPGRPHIQSQLNEFAANAPVHYAAAQPAQFLPAPGPQQTPLNQFAAQAPVPYAPPPAVQVLSAPGPQQIQLKQFAAQAPAHYTAPPAVQVLPAPGPQKIQLNQFAAQVPVNYAAPLPVQVKQGPGSHSIRNVFAAQVPVYHAASLPVHAGLLPRQVAPSQYFEAERKQQIAPVRPPLVPGLQNVQVQELPTLQYQNQTHLDENQNLFPSSDFVGMTPAEQSVRSMKENSESDEGMSSMGESVEASPHGISSVGEPVQTSPHTPNINEARHSRRKGRSPAAEVKNYKRLLTYQEKLVVEKGLPKSRLQIEFESGITLISPRPAYELGIKPISTASPFKPSDAMPVCSGSLMGDADGLEVTPLNLISPKPSLDCPPESDDLKPEQISHPVSNYLKPAGTEGQERHVENQSGQENISPPGYIFQGGSKISEAWLSGYESGLRVREVYCHGCNNYGSVVPVVFDV